MGNCACCTVQLLKSAPRKLLDVLDVIALCSLIWVLSLIRLSEKRIFWRSDFKKGHCCTVYGRVL